MKVNPEHNYATHFTNCIVVSALISPFTVSLCFPSLRLIKSRTSGDVETHILTQLPTGLKYLQMYVYNILWTVSCTYIFYVCSTVIVTPVNVCFKHTSINENYYYTIIGTALS